MASKKCKHDACSCVVGEKEDYCSEICKDSKGRTEIACECGHATCSGTELRV